MTSLEHDHLAPRGEVGGGVRRFSGDGRGPRFARPDDDVPALPADALYGRLLASAAQHLDGAGPPPRARIRLADGALEPLPLDRWLAPADAADEAILTAVEAPVLDLGCGPGRHLARLRELGKDGLGVDLSPVAVAFARERGATAINGSLWDAVPGTYATILLLDGNIGIGGNPVALLQRAGELLAPGGAIVVETGAATRRVRVRIEAPGMVSDWFRWAWVGGDDAAAVAGRAGFEVAGRRELSGRTFVTLRRPE
ncbi:class I SAM-dependent methyltransferase [Solirubrobacter sp. CPCC 204708]|uniref:Class I SAM-dependent methyltransferase n=1 Tax=Solirubrobacter deserti TaxID=2282478 RepID=A0ABT4RH97_9ACTN|nr:class I SAM-dependent methyltransferase [Solirubrobacter deserti]MBE2315241.1 class I SAM-dependent methyltransferase [Solirubrobacter deserti]MDA0137925.1 class I SAM-dependent methyltransferase [Solirubrobacter deserti]